MNSTTPNGHDAGAVEPAVFDTSPLILLDALGYVSLLPVLFEVFITPTVAEELRAQPDKPGDTVSRLPWVKQRFPSVETLHRVQTELSKDPGEEATIALALDLSAIAVLDEHPARAYARKIALRHIGTLGILLKLHRLDLASQNLEQDIEALAVQGMRMSDTLKSKVLTNWYGTG